MVDIKKVDSELYNDVSLIKITNKIGAFVEIYTLGATIKKIVVPDNSGKLTDVILGFDTPDEYIKKGGYYGAIVGRNANRIKNSKVTIDDQDYILTTNDGDAQIHGGFIGFDKKIWQIEDKTNSSVTLSLFSPNMEEGFPGNMIVFVRYSWDDNCVLSINYSAKCDKDTICNLTNHCYFNLTGCKDNVLDTYLKINAAKYTVADKTVTPTGEIKPVENTPLDFTSFKKIGEDIQNPELLFNGYDHNFCLDGKKLRYVAEAFSEESGIMLKCKTDQVGLQLYTSNKDLSFTGKGNILYNKYLGFCLETQAFPDALNHKNFPSTILKAEKEYKTTTIYEFSTI